MSPSGTKQELARPRQVTVAGWVIVGASVAVVISVFAQVSSLGTLETTRTLEKALSTPPASDLGVDVEAARTALRVLGMVAAACAAATAVLGWHVLQRSRGARLGLALLALPLFVSGVASGGLMSSVVVAGAVMLWLQPSRDWFAGRPTASSPSPARATPATPATPVAPVTSAPQVNPYAGGPPPQVDAPPNRPQQLVWACVLTWLGTGVVVAVLGVSLGVLLTAPESVLDEVVRANPELADQGIDTAVIRTAALVMVGLIVVWALAAAALAALVWRGQGWAHVALVISAGMAALLCLLGLLVNPVLGVPLLACIGTVVLLLRGEVRSWLRARAA